jgi:hypothetical protein
MKRAKTLAGLQCQGRRKGGRNSLVAEINEVHVRCSDVSKCSDMRSDFHDDSFSIRIILILLTKELKQL